MGEEAVSRLQWQRLHRALSYARDARRKRGEKRVGLEMLETQKWEKHPSVSCPPAFQSLSSHWPNPDESLENLSFL